MARPHSTVATLPDKPKPDASPIPDGYTRKAKPDKPPASFIDPKAPYPLTVHPAGYYSKKIRGKVHYFARWDEGAEEAEKRYLAQQADLEVGRTPRGTEGEQNGAGLTVRALLNAFRAYKLRAKEEGDITPRTYADCVRVCDFLADHLDRQRLVSDLCPADFQKLKAKLRAQKRDGAEKSLIVLGNWITRIRSVFNYAVDELKLPAAVHFGREFGKPKAERIQEQKQAKVEEDGERTFTAEEIRKLLAEASQPLKSMILLAINCGLGNSDIGQMRFVHLDLAGRWLNYPRPKTKRRRKCHLWAETVESIQEWLRQRPDPRDDADAKLVYLTRLGQSWHKETGDNPLSVEFKRLLDLLDINGGRGFYNLRHTFRTEAGPCADLEALYYAMGHRLPGMADTYVESIQPERLHRVAETVRGWLWAPKSQQSG